MNLRNSTIGIGLAIALAAPVASSAAAMSASHGAKKPVLKAHTTVAIKSPMLITLSTPRGSYIVVAATANTPSEVISVNACQETGLCLPAVDPPDTGSGPT